MVSFSFLLFILFLTVALHAVLSLVSRHCLQFTCRFLIHLISTVTAGTCYQKPCSPTYTYIREMASSTEVEYDIHGLIYKKTGEHVE